MGGMRGVGERGQREGGEGATVTNINIYIADVEEYTEEGLAHSQNVQQCVSVLLDKRVPVDCQDAQGRTPLHWAVQLPSKCTTDRVRCRHYYQRLWQSLPCICTGQCGKWSPRNH